MLKFTPLWLSLCLPSLAPTCFAQDDPSTVAKAQERASATVQAHLNWTKQTSPGATIRGEESSRHPDAVQYRLFVSGLPADTTYTAVSWQVNATPTQIMHCITIGKDGVLTCAGRRPDECGDATKPDDAIDFTFYPQNGEPYRLLFVSEHDPQSKVAIVLVPNPVEAKDKGCSLSAMRLSPKFELSYITGSGFEPNSQVSFDTQSWGEKHKIPSRADANGNLQLIMLNGVVGHERGVTTVKALGADCSPSIEFEWGPVNLPASGTAQQQMQSNWDAGCGSVPPPAEDLQWLAAQQKALATLDSALVADIRRLFELQGLRKTLERSALAQPQGDRALLMPSLSCLQKPDQVARLFDTKMAAKMSSDEMIDLYVLVFARHFRREDVEAVLASYESSGGKKNLPNDPAVFADLQAVGRDYTQKIVVPRVVAEVQKELAPAKQH